MSFNKKYVQHIKKYNDDFEVCYALRSLKFCFDDMSHYDNCMFNPLGLVGDDNCQATGITEKQVQIADLYRYKSKGKITNV